jgi:hypothetical protein
MHIKGARSRAKTMRNSPMNDCTITAAHNKHFYSIFHHYVKGKKRVGV